MFSRLLRIVASLALVMGAYFLYALLVVPWVQSAGANQDETVLTPLPNDQRVPGHIRRLLPYFSAGDWELQDPILLENSQFALMLRDYQSLPGGQFKLHPCTLLFFPDGRPDEPDLSSRVLILRAEEGAILDFDRDIDLSRAEVGRLRGGRLVGRVTIRGNVGQLGSSKAAHPGSGPNGDQLWIETRDIDLRPDRIWTPHTVQFRLGNHRGQGREMRMTFAGEGSEESLQKPSIEAVKSFQLLHDVQLHVELPSKGLLPKQPSKNATSAPTAIADDARNAPLEVRCDGRFRFDVEKMAANFEDGVEVTRLNADGPGERLNCDLLTIHFEHNQAAKGMVPRMADRIAGRNPPRKAGGQDHTQKSAAETDKPSRSLEATRIEARGEPVVVRSPAVNGYARGEYLEFDIRSQRLMLNSQHRVTLRYQTADMEAAQLRYAAGKPGQLGQIWAAGPGKLSATIPTEDGAELDVQEQQGFEATWAGQLQVRPDGDRQLISIVDKARVSYAGTGAMSADEIWLWLDQAAAGPSGAPPNDPSPPRDDKNPSATQRLAKLTPHSLLARGQVSVDASQMSGVAERLEVWFQQLTQAGDKKGPGQSLAAFGRDKRTRESSNHYHVEGQLVRLLVGIAADRSAVLKDVTLSGKINLAERMAGQNDDKPLLVTGEQLRLQAADTPQATLSVSGQPAHVEARGMMIEGPAVNLDKENNQLWINAAGRMTLPVDRDLHGQRLEVAESLNISWQGHMIFDGQTVRFDRDVVAATQEQRLQTGQLDVSLSRRIQFAERIDGVKTKRNNQGKLDKIDVAQINCRHGVLLESSTVENGRRTSWERMQTDDLAIDQLTGHLGAQGPGWVSSVREGSATGHEAFGGVRPVSGIGGSSASGTQRGEMRSENDKLVFVKVNFQKGIRGNIHQRELIFADQVRCIYGPVSDWSAELDPEKVTGPQADELILTCDQLALRQMGMQPMGRQRSVEFEALGNATVEGESFTAQGHRMTYTTAKDLLVLEGTGQSDARLTRQSRVGGPTSQAAAQKIQYWRKKNRVEVQNARFGAGTWDGGK